MSCAINNPEDCFGPCSCGKRPSAPPLAREAAAPSPDAEHAAWLADKIVACGDYAKEAAEMLRRWPASPQAAAPASEVEKDAREKLRRLAERARRAWAINPPSTVVLLEEMRQIDDGLREVLRAAMAVSAPAQQTKE